MLRLNQYNRYKVFSSDDKQIIYVYDNFKEELVYDFHILSLGNYIIKSDKLWVYHLWEYMINNHPQLVHWIQAVCLEEKKWKAV